MTTKLPEDVRARLVAALARLLVVDYQREAPGDLEENRPHAAA